MNSEVSEAVRWAIRQQVTVRLTASDIEIQWLNWVTLSGNLSGHSTSGLTADHRPEILWFWLLSLRNSWTLPLKLWILNFEFKASSFDPSDSPWDLPFTHRVLLCLLGEFSWTYVENPLEFLHELIRSDFVSGSSRDHRVGTSEEAPTTSHVSWITI